MGNGSYELYEESSVMDMGKSVGGVFVTKNLLGPHYEIVGQACLINIHSGETNLDGVHFRCVTQDLGHELTDLDETLGIQRVGPETMHRYF